MKLGNWWQEFKAFSVKGNMIDLAVAVVLATAFNDVIKSLVNNVIMPLVSYVQPGGGGYRAWKLGNVEIGAFIGALVNFLIIALVLFILVSKIIGAIRKRSTPPAEPATRECPLCCSKIAARASKCPHCTGDIDPLTKST